MVAVISPAWFPPGDLFTFLPWPVSPITATLKVLNDVTIALDSKQYCAAICIVLAKAFDTVDHSILVGRLRSIGVSVGSLAWFANYLSQTVQYVKSEYLLSQPPREYPKARS